MCAPSRSGGTGRPSGAGRSQVGGGDIQLAADAHEGLASRADPVTQLERSSTLEIVMGSAATTNCSSAAVASAARVSDLSAGSCDLQPAARPAGVSAGNPSRRGSCWKVWTAAHSRVRTHLLCLGQPPYGDYSPISFRLRRIRAPLHAGIAVQRPRIASESAPGWSPDGVGTCDRALDGDDPGGRP
jgi:hypothetical protein